MSAGKCPNEGHLLVLTEKICCYWLQAGAQDVNFLYSLAWIDLTGGPLVITAPDTSGRFYELQFVDVYSETPLLIGEDNPEVLLLQGVPLLSDRCPHLQKHPAFWSVLQIEWNLTCKSRACIF